jgi:bacillithiol system protein YtxJ
MAVFSVLESIDALDALFEVSHRAPVVLFKHSKTCGISAHLLEEIRTVDSDISVVVVQSHREISNEVEQRTGFRHQSPQAFVIRDGKAVYHASHYGIDPAAINAHLEDRK